MSSRYLLHILSQVTITFKINYFKLYLYCQVNEDGKSLVPAATRCVLGFSAVASPELLEEWNFRGSRPATARHFRKAKK